MSTADAKAHLDQGAGEPTEGFITSADLKDAFDDLEAAWQADIAAVGGSGTGSLIVASSQAPLAVRAVANYVCDGTNDEAQINAAILEAAAIPGTLTDPNSDGGAGRVFLTAGRYNIADSVLMRTGVALQGQGWLTELFAVSSLAGAGVIEIVDADAHAFTISDLWVNGNGTTGSAHGIYFDATGGGDFSERPDTNPDSYITIDHVLVSNCKASGADRHGFYLKGTSGGSRAAKLINCHSWVCDGYGFYLDGTSDCHLTDCTASTAGSGSTQHGFVIAGGNTQLIGCKSYYCEGNGFHLTSGRVNMIGCVAQDNAYWGFYMSSSDGNIVGGQADSNGRLDNSAGNGGGFYVATSCTIVGVNVFDRAQTPGSPQLIGFEIASALNKCLISGRVEVPSGSNHVVNPSNLSSSSNIINIVRSDTTPLQYPGSGGSSGVSTLNLGVGVSNGDPDDGTLIVRH